MSRFDAGAQVSSLKAPSDSVQREIIFSLRYDDYGPPKHLMTTLTATALPSAVHRNEDDYLAGSPIGWIDTEMAHLGQTIWHLFDMARNIDVDSQMFNN